MVDIPPKQGLVKQMLDDGMKQARIAETLNISKQAVSKMVIKLRKKGLIKGGVDKGGVVRLVNPLQGRDENWRYHALEFEIKPYYFTKKYEDMRQHLGSHCIPFGNWKLILYKRKVIMWLNGGTDFVHPDKHTAIRMSMADFQKALTFAANRYGFRVWKDQKANIRILKHHLAKTNSKLNEAVDEGHVKLKGEDGKVWLILDRSKGLKEHEYVHTQQAVDDSDRVEAWLTDIRQHDLPTPLQSYEMLVMQNKLSQITADNMKSHISAVKKLADGVEKLTRVVEHLNK